MAGTKLLVVDDEPDAVLVLTKTLLARGYSVITAENGLQAINMAKAEKPDLILLDILMPDMDGMQVALTLQENATTRNIPVIFLTCLVSKKTQDVELQYHNTDQYVFMSKPYDLDNLLVEINRLTSVHVG